jgi:hypothetical protein
MRQDIALWVAAYNSLSAGLNITADNSDKASARVAIPLD